VISKLKPKSEFTKNVLTLMTGTTIAQAIPIAISPILTRLYTPEDFGVWALYMSILMIFGNLVAGKYELAILIPKHDIEAKNIVLLSLLFASIFSSILFIIVCMFHSEILIILKNDDISFWLYILPFNVFLVSAISILYFWNNRKKKYKLLAKNQILQSSSQGIVNLGIGFFSKINAGLIIGTLIGNIMSFLFMLKHSKKDLVLNFSKFRLFYVIKKYKKFPLFMLPSGLLENVSAQLPIFFLGSFFGSAIVGFYSLSQRIVRIPIMLIGSSIGNVFRQEASEHLNKYGNCEKVFLNTFKRLLIISTLPFIVFYFIAPYLFEFVFGEKWRIAGEYAQILTPLFYLQFIVSPLSNMFMIAQKQQYDLIMQIYLIGSVILSFIIGYKFFNDVKVTLYIFTFVYSLKYIFEFILSYKFSKGK